MALAAFAGIPARAQDTQRIVVTGLLEPAAPSVAGFSDRTPLARTPLAATVASEAMLRDNGARNLSDLTRVDASVGDSYNAEGYWSFLSVRGFTLDNRFNYRRDGLPINAETSIGLDNKVRLEILKGTSGIQAGTSAPGGLVNLVVKRPDGPVRSARVETRQGGGTATAVDIGERFGSEDQFGLRVNAAYEDLDPQTRSARGHRRLVAVAADTRLSKDTLIEIEFESSRQQQPSVPGFSLLGNRVPDANEIDPRTNINNQTWSQPVVLSGNTASLRITQALSPDWRASAHAMTQRLTSDDRVAFPFGVFDPDTFECPQWCDRFAPDGTFTLWQFASDGERRRSDALDLSLAGRTTLAGIEHRLQTGVLFTRYRARFGAQVFDIAGTGRIDGGLVTPPSAGSADTNTDRSERSTEIYLRNAMQLSTDWKLWAGLRHTSLTRDSVRTDGSAPTAYSQSATLPWLALAWQATPATMLYASLGQGLESDVVPNRPRYTNRAQALPALKSRQLEAGVKHNANGIEAALVAFSITRPQTSDFGSCDSDDTCTRANDGDAVHRGVEASLATQQGAWRWQASAMLLRARREGAADSALNGLTPVNVPERSLRLQARYALTTGAELQASMSHESSRSVLPDGSAHIPAWTRLDVGLKAQQRISSALLTWRIGIDNLADTRAWKEAPYQFSHAYLFPMAPRSVRVSLQTEL
ncbi:MAG: TonB-dependent siderophore receptor [Burkholderiaceae bacterium]|nr:TonB-dependent siderophore receptor [Burkholderiaceae bacterium]